MIEQHLVAASSTTQTVVALSSGEAELYALSKSASRALGAEAMLRDLAVSLPPRVLVDSTASKGISSRRGVGRIKHLHTQVLWVQLVVARRGLRIDKIPGEGNPSDLGTKHLGQTPMKRCMGYVGVRTAGGRSDFALRAAH